MDLVVMRHGHAEAIARCDEERRLTSRGRENAANVARALRLLGLRPQAIVASPLVRAQQTASIVARELAHELDAELAVQTEPLLAPESRVEHTVEALATDATCLVIVSHMPLVSALLGRMLCSSSTATLPLSTSCAVWLELSRPASLDGRLRAALSPQVAAQLSGGHDR